MTTTIPSPSDLFHQLEERHHEAERLRAAISTLYWDQETHMPPGAAAGRASQLATLEGIAHRHFASPEMGHLLDALGNGASSHLTPLQNRAVGELRRRYERAIRIPEDLARELASAASRSSQAWKEARKRDDFSIFAPELSNIVDLSRRKAEKLAHLDGSESLYDALLDGFEAGMTEGRLRPLLSELGDQTRALMRELAGSPDPPKDEIIYRSYDEQAQWDFSLELLAAMGFDFRRGRQDKSAHPFTESADPTDVRVTTRIQQNFFKDCFYSSIHEGGHALYEQGLTPDRVGPILARPASQGMHEAMSRLWEHLVGSSLGFWNYWFPKIRDRFPEALASVESEEFYRALNVSQPTLIRVDADEITYNLHIILRFELETALLDGKFNAADLPKRWREKFEELLGIVPPSDADGCLQDPHWAEGSIGYFPTYTLGNLYSAPIFAAAQRDLGRDLQEMFAAGDFLPLKKWLDREIHATGRSETPDEIIQRVSGEPLSVEPYMRYLRKKYRAIYRLSQ